MVLNLLKRYLLSNNFAILLVAHKISSACNLWSFENTKPWKLRQLQCIAPMQSLQRWVNCDERVPVLGRPWNRRSSCRHVNDTNSWLHMLIQTSYPYRRKFHKSLSTVQNSWERSRRIVNWIQYIFLILPLPSLSRFSALSLKRTQQAFPPFLSLAMADITFHNV